MLFRIALFLLCLGAGASAPASAADWARFLGPNGDGTSPETGLIDQIPAGGPPVKLDLAVGTGYAAPSVLGGKLALFHRLGDTEVLQILEVATGKPVWRHAYPTSYRDPYGYNNGPRAAPLMTSNRVYTFGAEGKLTCVNLQTGAEIWQRDTAKDFEVPEAFFGVGTTPILEGGKLIVMVGGQPNSGVVAFDPETGKTLWESVGEKNWQGQPMLGWTGDRSVEWRRWEKQASYSSPVPATIGGKRWVFCLMRQGLVGLDPADGSVRFSRWFRARVDESVNAANPVVLGDDVLISSAYYKSGSVLLRVGSGTPAFTERWKGLGLEMHWSTPVHVNGHLYGFSGRNEPDAIFRCIEFGTGIVKWEREERWAAHSAERPTVFGRGALILADGKLFAIGEGGLFGIFRPNAEKCEEVGRWQVPSLHHPCWAGPVLSNGLLFLRCEDRLVALDLTRH
jgi:outer membrane protein assembly factor BamB